MEKRKSQSDEKLTASKFSLDEEVPDMYRLDFALLSPLKVSLFPAKSFPSVTECGNRDSILRLEMNEIDLGKSFPSHDQVSPPFEERTMMQQKEMTSRLGSSEKIRLGQNHETVFGHINSPPNQEPKVEALVIKRVKQGSLIRRRSSSLPDIDRINLPQQIMMGADVDADFIKSELDIFSHIEDETRSTLPNNGKNSKPLDSLFKSNTICAKTYSSSSASLSFSKRNENYMYLHGKPLAGVQSLPRINRSPTPNDTYSRKGGSSPLNIPSSPNKSPSKLGMSGAESTGAGSFGDLMNLLQFGSCRNSPTNSEILAAAVPLETVTTRSPITSHRVLGEAPSTSSNSSSQISITGSFFQSTPPWISNSSCASTLYNGAVPRLNICSAEDENDVEGSLQNPLKQGTYVYEEQHEKRSRTNKSLRHRLCAVQGVDEKDGIIITTRESLSRPSSQSSPSPSLCHSSSETSIESAASFRIHSSHSEANLGTIPMSSSCCGVNLRNTPTPTSPPYETSPSLLSKVGTPEALDLQQPCQSPKCPPHFLGAATEIERNRSRKPEKSPKSPQRIDRSYLARKNGVQNNNINTIAGKDSSKSGSNESFPKVKASRSTFSPGKRLGKILKTRTPNCQEHVKSYDTENNSQDSFRFDGKNSGRNQKVLPTVERAKRLSKLIQQRQHTQLQFSLNIAMVRGLNYISFQIRCLSQRLFKLDFILSWEIKKAWQNCICPKFRLNHPQLILKHIHTYDYLNMYEMYNMKLTCALIKYSTHITLMTACYAYVCIIILLP